MADNHFNTEWEQEIGLYLDNELAEKSRERVERHLRRCETSVRYYRILQREEQLLAGRLRHDIHPYLKAEKFADSVMESLPVQPTNPVWHKIKTAGTACFDFFRRPGYSRVAFAVSILICVVGILASLSISTPEEPRIISLKKNGRVISTALPEPVMVQRLEGEFYEFPDTSFAYVMPGSAFMIENYQEGSGEENVGSDRRLTLSFGEMFLDVHPEKEGFTIDCGNARVTVFGTQFYIATTSGHNKKTTIAVREGGIMVEKQGEVELGKTLVKGGQMTQVITKNNKVILQAPEPISSDLKQKLDLFNEAYQNRAQLKDLPLYDPFEPLNDPSANTPYELHQHGDWRNVITH